MNKTLLAIIGVCAVGCAHYPAPTDQMAKSIAAVRGAEEAGAREDPQAALHLKLAQDQLEQAQELMRKEDNQRAEDRALRAGNDAELAVALAHEQAGKAKLSRFTEAHAAPTAPAAPAVVPAPTAPAPAAPVPGAVR